ncbi:Tad domain-containing protein [Kocuria aegyptia]|uniref:Putative Flp pilus-assembly TadG-like N-terminal domain-containing protein n=1 Tax=Kocuria aegyptia TaxID=330943 RepID=A0ABN2L382_9MICC
MRRLITSLRGTERGGISVMVAMLMVVLLGAAAVALDTGLIYAERAQLQNGADAAALAVAEECANDELVCSVSAASLGGQYADANSKDAASDATILELNTTGDFVRVQASTRDGVTGSDKLGLTFSSMLWGTEPTVGATATASWSMFPHGGPSILPLAFAPCVFDLDGGVQLIRFHGNTSPPSCTSTSPSGQVLPGGFSWLAGSDSDCNLDVENDTDVPSKPGVSSPEGCVDVLKSLYEQTALLPVYDDFDPAGGANGSYHIKGWAAFKILGWKVSGSEQKDNDIYPDATCTGNCRGLIGEFVSFGTLADGFTGTTDPDADFGASIVTLTK